VLSQQTQLTAQKAEAAADDRKVWRLESVTYGPLSITRSGDDHDALAKAFGQLKVVAVSSKTDPDLRIQWH